MTWLARVLTRKSPSNSFCANNGQEFNQISVVQFDAMPMLATGAKSITAMRSIMQKPTKTILKSFCQRKYVGWDNDVDEQMMMMMILMLLTKNNDVGSMRLFGSVTSYT